MLLSAPIIGLFFSSRRRHTRFDCDWSSDVCSSDLASPSHPNAAAALGAPAPAALLLLQILPVLPPHRANHARRGPRFSVVAPCRRGGGGGRGAGRGKRSRSGGARFF